MPIDDNLFIMMAEWLTDRLAGWLTEMVSVCLSINRPASALLYCLTDRSSAQPSMRPVVFPHFTNDGRFGRISQTMAGT